MCSLHAVPLFCLSLTRYDILIEDLVLRKAPAEAGVTFAKSDIIRRRFTYFSWLFSLLHCSSTSLTRYTHVHANV